MWAVFIAFQRELNCCPGRNGMHSQAAKEEREKMLISAYESWHTYIIFIHTKQEIKLGSCNINLIRRKKSFLLIFGNLLKVNKGCVTEILEYSEKNNQITLFLYFVDPASQP